ncbi:DUF4058 family protein [Nostoc sp. PA-18-2419]|nr:DUF4058 family protein [Nostoc sp. PA-18-2419]
MLSPFPGMNPHLEYPASGKEYMVSLAIANW